MKRTMIAISALALVAGCQNVSQRQMTGAGAGAVIGAGIGALAGGDDRRNAAIGAAIGAIAGGAVGTYMDRQEAALRERTRNTGIEIERVGDQIALTLPSGVTFPVDSATIQPNFQSPLQSVAQTLVDYPSTAVDVIGHASADGPDDYNLELSQRRARSVSSFLVASGVQDLRLNAIGVGENQPIADNATAAGRAQNRRVEILLTPVVEGSAGGSELLG